jgi:hypothetical protein
MKQYFFDIANSLHVQYDYRGRPLENTDQAHELAELIALDAEYCHDDSHLPGIEVQVRDIAGRHLFSVPIREIQPIM